LFINLNLLIWSSRYLVDWPPDCQIIDLITR